MNIPLFVYLEIGKKRVLPNDEEKGVEWSK